jgi:hypothetical protein
MTWAEERRPDGENREATKKGLTVRTTGSKSSKGKRRSVAGRGQRSAMKSRDGSQSMRARAAGKKFQRAGDGCGG